MVVCYFCVLLIGGCCVVYRNTCFGLWVAGLVGSVAVLWLLVLIVLLCAMRFTFVSCWLVISFVYIGC